MLMKTVILHMYQQLFILPTEHHLRFGTGLVWILGLTQMATSYLMNLAEINLLSLCVLHKNAEIVNVVVQQKLFALQGIPTKPEMSL